MRLYRVYFNRTSDAPQVWSVDEGDPSTEIHVMAVMLKGCTVQTVADLNVPVNPDTPRAWIEAVGWMTVEQGVATITARL